MVACVALLAPVDASAAASIQCRQTELMKPGCVATSINHVPLHFSASCQLCSGGGSDIKCTPGEQATPQTLGVDDAATNTKVPGAITPAGSCAFQVPLWSFSGTLVGGKSYNIVLEVAGQPKLLLLAFKAGQSSGPPVDLGVPPHADGAAAKDGGGQSKDGAASPGDGAKIPGATDAGGCSCRLRPGMGASGVGALPWLLVLGLVVRTRARRRRRRAGLPSR